MWTAIGARSKDRRQYRNDQVYVWRKCEWRKRKANGQETKTCIGIGDGFSDYELTNKAVNGSEFEQLDSVEMKEFEKGFAGIPADWKD